LVEFDSEAWMYMNVDGKLACRSNQDAEVELVQLDAFSDFTHVYREGLPGPEVDTYIAAVRDGLRYAPPGVDVRYFIARLGGVPLSMLSLLTTGHVSGVYAVATLESARGQGLAARLVQTSLETARSLGSRYLFLQTTEGDEAETCFRRMGFETHFARIGLTTPDAAELDHG
jgi:GNAT superfamily N-acetyltransferase